MPAQTIALDPSQIARLQKYLADAVSSDSPAELRAYAIKALNAALLQLAKAHETLEVRRKKTKTVSTATVIAGSETEEGAEETAIQDVKQVYDDIDSVLTLDASLEQELDQESRPDLLHKLTLDEQTWIYKQLPESFKGTPLTQSLIAEALRIGKAKNPRDPVAHGIVVRFPAIAEEVWSLQAKRAVAPESALVGNLFGVISVANDPAKGVEARDKFKTFTTTKEFLAQPEKVAEHSWKYIISSENLTRIVLEPESTGFWSLLGSTVSRAWRSKTTFQENLSAKDLLTTAKNENAPTSVRQAIKDSVTNASFWEKVLRFFGVPAGVSGKFTQKERDEIAGLDIKAKAPEVIKEIAPSILTATVEEPANKLHLSADAQQYADNMKDTHNALLKGVALKKAVVPVPVVIPVKAAAIIVSTPTIADTSSDTSFVPKATHSVHHRSAELAKELIQYGRVNNSQDDVAVDDLDEYALEDYTDEQYINTDTALEFPALPEDYKGEFEVVPATKEYSIEENSKLEYSINGNAVSAESKVRLPDKLSAGFAPKHTQLVHEELLNKHAEDRKAVREIKAAVHEQLQKSPRFAEKTKSQGTSPITVGSASHLSPTKTAPVASAVAPAPEDQENSPSENIYSGPTKSLTIDALKLKLAKQPVTQQSTAVSPLGTNNNVVNQPLRI